MKLEARMKNGAFKIRIAPVIRSLLLCALLPAAVSGQNAGGTGASITDAGAQTAGEIQAQKLLEQAQHHAARGNYSAALSAVHEGLGIAPEHPLLLQIGAQIYTARGAYVLAEDCWNRLKEADPDNDQYQIGLAGIYVRQGFTKKAKPMLDAALKRDPMSVPARFYLAVVRQHEGKPGEAEKLLRARSSIETGQFASWIDGEYQSVLRLLGRRGFNEYSAIALTGSAAENEQRQKHNVSEMLKKVKEHIYRSSLAAEEQDWLKAIEELNKARLAGATAPAVYQDLARYAWMSGKHEQSRGLLESLSARHPEQSSIPSALGILCLEDGQTAAAVRHLKAAVSADPVNAEARFALACAYAQSEEITKARISLLRLQRLIKKHPGLEISTVPGYAEALRSHAELHALLKEIFPEYSQDTPDTK